MLLQRRKKSQIGNLKKKRERRQKENEKHRPSKSKNMASSQQQQQQQQNCFLLPNALTTHIQTGTSILTGHRASKKMVTDEFLS
jgi:hypothetical protein